MSRFSLCPRCPPHLATMARNDLPDDPPWCGVRDKVNGKEGSTHGYW